MAHYGGGLDQPTAIKLGTGRASEIVRTQKIACGLDNAKSGRDAVLRKADFLSSFRYRPFIGLTNRPYLWFLHHVAQLLLFYFHYCFYFVVVAAFIVVCDD
jgi:hypothetical protein